MRFSSSNPGYAIPVRWIFGGHRIRSCNVRWPRSSPVCERHGRDGQRASNSHDRAHLVPGRHPQVESSQASSRTPTNLDGLRLPVFDIGHLLGHHQRDQEPVYQGDGSKMLHLRCHHRDGLASPNSSHRFGARRRCQPWFRRGHPSLDRSFAAQGKRILWKLRVPHVHHGVQR